MLGIALREHFPQYYGYFSTRSFTLWPPAHHGHNRLLGRIKGVDGIKTGYTRASGFNLVSSVSDGDRRLVAVVMGGSAAAAATSQMAALIKPICRRRRLAAAAAWSPRPTATGPIRALAKVFLPKHECADPG